MNCPYCGGKTEHEEVGVGVGPLIGPYKCTDCSSQQIVEGEDSSYALPSERRLGWWKGDQRIIDLIRVVDAIVSTDKHHTFPQKAAWRVSAKAELIKLLNP